MSRLWSPRLLAAIIGGAALIGGGGALLYHALHKPPIIPPAIQTAVTFPILIPDQRQSQPYPVMNMRYDASLSRLTYQTAISGSLIDISEQATPEAFVDVPQAYDKLIASLVEYKSFGSPQGTVSLTHPKELHGAQSAVMNGKGTLLFARPNKDLDDASWQRLFSKLIIQN